MNWLCSAQIMPKKHACIVMQWSPGAHVRPPLLYLATRATFFNTLLECDSTPM